MAKGKPELQMGYGGLKRPGKGTPFTVNTGGQKLVDKIRGNYSSRKKTTKKKRYA